MFFICSHDIALIQEKYQNDIPECSKCSFLSFVPAKQDVSIFFDSPLCLPFGCWSNLQLSTTSIPSTGETNESLKNKLLLL